MLTIHKAKTISSGERSVLAALRNHKGRSIIIVPDAFTLSVETSIFRELGRQGTFDVEVMSFARLAAVVLGSAAEKCLSPAGCVMLMEKVALKYAPDLRVYGRVAKKPGFAAEIYAAITAIRNSGISVDQLEKAAAHLSGYVKDKTSDIVTLYKGYLEELSRSHADSTTWLEKLAEEIRKGSDALTDADFFVMDHFDFNAKQMEVLCALMVYRNVVVAVADHGGSDNYRVYPRTYAKLIHAAKSIGIEPEEDVIAEESFSSEKQIIANKVFAYGYKEGTSEHIRLVEAKDKEEEVTLLATEIVRLVRKKGKRFRDVAVITPSFEEYAPYLERIFAYYDIPFFADARYPLARCDVFDHILEGFDLVVHEFDKISVSKYVSHALFSDVSEENKAFTEGDKALFDDYVMAYGVDRSIFRRPFDLCKEDGEECLAAAERIRVALVSELNEFIHAKPQDTVHAYVDVMRAFLERNHFDARIAVYAKAIHDAGHLKESNVIGQSPEKIVSLLRTLEEVRGDDVVTREEFLFALRSGAEQMKIAALPVSLDCVYFAPVEQAMYTPIHSMFLLGAEEGLFPLETVKEGILGMREYTEWQKLDIVVENAGAEELVRSRFHTLQLLLRPEYLHLSYTSFASECVKELSSIFTLGIEKAGEILASYSIEDIVPTRAVADNYLAEYSRREREGLLSERERAFAEVIAEATERSFPIPAYDDVPERIATNCFFRNGKTNISEIETYYSCPFKHFVRNGLQLQERDVARSDNRDVGNIVHDCLYRFMEKESNRRLEPAAAEIVARKIAEDILSERKYQVLFRSEGAHLTERFANAAVAAVLLVREQVQASSFEPTYFEKRFGGHDLPALDLGKVRVSGKMDRVDLYKNADGETAAAAFDYKTGSSNISPSDLYYGRKLQLQIYLAVLRNMGVVPAAALYFDLKGGGKKDDSHYLHGQILTDYVLPLDNSSKEKKSKYTGMGVDEKTGELKMKTDTAVSRVQMDAMIDYAVLLARKAVDDILNGCILPSPATGESYNCICTSCEVRNICRHGKKYCRDEKRTLHVTDIERVVRPEEEDAAD